MSEYTPSEEGTRRFSRRLLARRRNGPNEIAPKGPLNSVSPVIPFTALYTPTPTPRERRSIHLDFTPILTPTPKKSTGRRSFIPPHLQAYNRQFLFGLGIFLGLSALYKGLSLFKETFTTNVEPSIATTSAESLEVSELASTEPVISTVETVEVVQDPMTLRLYEESQAQVSALSYQITRLKQEVQSSLASSKAACDKEISACNNMLNVTSSSLSRCEMRVQQIEMDSSHFVEKLESDFQQNIASIVTTKNKQIHELENTISKLQSDIKNLSSIVSETRRPVEEVTKQVPILDQVDKELMASAAVIVILTALATICFVASIYLYQEKNRLSEFNKRLSSQLDTSHLTAISSPPPIVLEAELVTDTIQTDELLAMAVEDTRASILRGVTAHVREIEQQHEVEMIRLRSLLVETGTASREISLAIKGIISDTSIVSTAAHNTPGLSDILSSSSSDEEDEIQFSSLSQRLESAATTPIRIETTNWLSKAAIKTTSQQPTVCPPSSVLQPVAIESFIIGSPKLPQGRNLMEYAVSDDDDDDDGSSEESSSEMALEQIRGNFGFTH